MMIDLDEVKNVVDNADVFTIGFRLFPERLIIDTRSEGDTGPMVRIVEPVASVEERFFWLGKERPQFGVPERFSFFVWPHSMRYFDESGLGDMIRHRIYPESPDGEIGREMAQATIKLYQLERQAEVDAILGRNYHSLWERALT